jgi:hypothetical protein
MHSYQKILVGSFVALCLCQAFTWYSISCADVDFKNQLQSEKKYFQRTQKEYGDLCKVCKKTSGFVCFKVTVPKGITCLENEIVYGKNGQLSSISVMECANSHQVLKPKAPGQFKIELQTVK